MITTDADHQLVKAEEGWHKLVVGRDDLEVAICVARFILEAQLSDSDLRKLVSGMEIGALRLEQIDRGADGTEFFMP